MYCMVIGGNDLAITGRASGEEEEEKENGKKGRMMSLMRKMNGKMGRSRA